MTSSAIAVEIPAAPEYGAVELKKWINKHTIRGFAITISLLLLLFLLYFTLVKITQAQNAKPKMAPIVKMTLSDLPPPDQSIEESAPPPSQQVLNQGPASRAGIPIPVPEAQIKEDLKDFATMNELGRASSKGGDGVDLGGFASNIDFNTDVKVGKIEDEPEPDAFIPVEKEPNVDLEKLQKRVVYPDIARRAGIEGKVIVRVLVGKDGKPRKTLIEYSDSELLNDAAVKAVKEATYTPAIQNQQPVTCWVSIPINFKLR